MVAFIGIVGLCLLLTVAGDAFEVMLLPRRVRRRLRFVEFLFQGSWAAWVWIARRFTAGRTRDAFLSVFGPLSMVLLLSCWASGLIVGFGLLHWALEALLGAPTSLLHHLYLSGSTFFTLGYGDVLPGTKVGRGLAVFEAGVGLAFIAVTIGYLPVLYQLFSRRESQVIL
ncbi:MAG TPA: potassium channel family protein, partial [Bryobacteraceae bacterium]